MFRGLLVGVLLAGLSACTTANMDSRDARQETGFQIVQSLTTEVGARLAGSKKEAEARRWAVVKLKSLGFSNVHEETFPFHAWERGYGFAEILRPVHLPLVMTALGGSVSTPRGGITARVEFVESYDALVKMPEGSLKGKIVFINDKMMRARDGSGYGPAVRKRSRGAIESAKRGAIAVVIRSAGTDNDRFAHTGNMRYEDGVKRIPGIAVSGPDADQIERLHAAGANITLRVDLRTRDLPRAISGNVIGDIVGKELPNEIVLIGAHLDSWDLGTGAIDDGAGVGMAIAAALRAAGPTLAPKRTIRVVLFGAEEYSGGGKGAGTGGDAYAEKHAHEIAWHKAAMEADFGAGAPWRFKTNVPEADLAFYENVHRHLRPLGIELGTNQAGGGTDIAPLKKAGVPVIDIDQDGTHYFDLHHTANDTLDKIDPAALEANVEAYARAIAVIVNR